MAAHRRHVRGLTRHYRGSSPVPPGIEIVLARPEEKNARVVEKNYHVSYGVVPMRDWGRTVVQSFFPDEKPRQRRPESATA